MNLVTSLILNAELPFSSSGLLITKPNERGNSYIEVDTELARYYRKQIPFKTNPQRYAPHITAIREEKYDTDLTKYCELKIPIEFKYDHFIHWNETYVWLAVECPQMELIRISLGLEPISELTMSPDKQHRFHITIGNMK